MFLQKLKFYLTHWNIKYRDYLEAEKEIVNNMIRRRRYMEKSDLKFYYDFPCDNGKKQEVRTSGSTGNPVKFWCSSYRIASSLALVDYRFKELGKTNNTRFARLWYPTTGHKWHQILREKLFRHENKELFFSYFDLVKKNKTIMDFINFVMYEKPEFLEAYAGGIIEIASYIISNNLSVRIPVIVTGAGMVTKKQHILIEKAFNCKHYDRYGCSEFGEIAHQIGGKYYETNPFLEIELSKDLKEFYSLYEAKDGDYEIFISDDRNTCTPFWRYRMHDVVTIKDHRIVAIKGRTERMYQIDDEILPTGLFYQAMKDFSIDQWQVEYKDKTLIVRTIPEILSDSEQTKFEKYFDKQFNFKYEKGNFTTVGRREKIPEIII